MIDLFLLAALQIVVIAVAVEVLYRKMPRGLQAKAFDNCQRMDGSISYHREQTERKARSRIRSDLWAAFLGVAVVGNLFVGFVHTMVIELPIGFRALAAFDPNHKQFVANLQKSNVIAADAASRKARMGSRESTEASQRILWKVWPIVLCIALVWFFASWYALAFAHRKSLEEYASGLKRRSKEYLMRDLSRIPS